MFITAKIPASTTMNSTIQMYGTLFNKEIEHNQEYYETFYLTIVHSEALKSTIVSNLKDNERVVIETINHGVVILGDLIDYKHKHLLKPVHTMPPKSSLDEDDDITNLKPRSNSVKSEPLVLKKTSFKDVDEELKLELIGNFFKIFRILLDGLNAGHKAHLISSSESIQNLLALSHWYLQQSLPIFDLEVVNQQQLVIIKEIIYLVYDYITCVKYDPDHLDLIRSIKYGEVLSSILHKTHPIGDKKPTITLSIESLTRIFFIIGISKEKVPLEPAYFYDLLLFNLKYNYTFTNDLYDHQVMNQSFFNWMTANMFDFQDKYLNDSFIKLIPSHKLFELRFKENQFQQLENFDSPEFVPISLYIRSSYDIGDVPQPEPLFAWLCLSSYILTYQYKLKSAVATTRLIFDIYNTLLKTPTIKDITINEFKWKLCHQKSPLIPLNKKLGEAKPIVSYILDCILTLLRFNINKKLSTKNFIISLKLIRKCLSIVIDDNYNYEELVNSLISLFKFNELYIRNSELSTEVLAVFESILQHPINTSLIYQLLLNFERFNNANIDPFVNLTNLKAFLLQKFDLRNDDKEKINLIDSEPDSPELVDTIAEFEPEVQETKTEVIEIDFNEIIINI